MNANIKTPQEEITFSQKIKYALIGNIPTFFFMSLIIHFLLNVIDERDKKIEQLILAYKKAAAVPVPVTPVSTDWISYISSLPWVDITVYSSVVLISVFLLARYVDVSKFSYNPDSAVKLMENSSAQQKEVLLSGEDLLRSLLEIKSEILHLSINFFKHNSAMLKNTPVTDAIILEAKSKYTDYLFSKVINNTENSLIPNWANSNWAKLDITQLNPNPDTLALATDLSTVLSASLY